MASVALYEKSNGRAVRIEEEDFLRTSFKTGRRISVIESALPFRVRFTAIQVPGYGPNNVPAIPLQIIGYSNFIL
jgi:hypothetical protein